MVKLSSVHDVPLEGLTVHSARLEGDKVRFLFSVKHFNSLRRIAVDNSFR